MLNADDTRDLTLVIILAHLDGSISLGRRKHLIAVIERESTPPLPQSGDIYSGAKEEGGS